MTTNNELAVIAKESGLEVSKVDSLLSKFSDSFNRAKEVAKASGGIVVTSEKQTKEMAAARTARLELKSIRIEVEKTRKDLKEQSLREGKAIDGMSNIIKALIIPVEEHLETQEKFAELKRAERAAALKADRIEKLSPYVENVYVYALDDLDSEAYNEILANAKQLFEQKKAEEAKVEADRLKAIEDEEKRQEEIRLENERLRKEVEIRQAEQAEKDAAAEKEREAEREANRKALEAKEAEAKKEREAAETKLAAERHAREEAEKKIQAEKEAQEKATADAEEAERKALLAPDKEKLMTFAKAIITIRDEKLPALKTKQAQEIVNLIEKSLTDLNDMIISKAKGL